MRGILWPAVLLIGTLAAGPSASCAGVGGEEKPQAGEKDSKKGGKPSKKPEADAVPVFTNEDLDRLGPDPHAPKTPAPGPADPAARAKPATDPLQQLSDEQARDAARKEQLGAAEREVAAAEARIKELEKRALAVRNPYLAPPIPPEGKAEEWKKMSGAERAAATDAELKEARKSLDDAKARLAKLRGDAR